MHFAHLRADFPNYSPWMDYSKYTDEGWYANAAIRHALTGHWRLPGDFNPAVALPVWPLLARAAFAVGGMSVVVLRSAGLLVWVGDLLLLYLLLRQAGVSRSGAQAGLLYLAASAYLWAFSRLALLEPVLLLFLLGSWWLAVRLRARPASEPTRARFPHLLAIGLLLLGALLTKTTALFLLPSTVYLLWAARGFALRRTLGDLLAVAGAGGLPWAVYFYGFVRPHYLPDFHYLFEANRWPQPTTASGWLWAFWFALHGLLWVGPVLCGLAGGLLLLGAFGRPMLWRQPLVPACLLACAGYIGFIGWHNNPQPRYYEVALLPLVLLVCLGADGLARRVRPLGVLAWGVLAFTTCANLRQTLGYLRHPEYTWLHAAEGIRQYIDAHPSEGRRLLLSVSGDDIMLMTGLPAICDDFGATDLAYRVHQYQPGWYAAWNELDPGSVEDISTVDRLEKVAEFPALDDDDRDLLVLYRLEPQPAGKATYDEEGEEEANRGLE